MAYSGVKRSKHFKAGKASRKEVFGKMMNKRVLKTNSTGLFQEWKGLIMSADSQKEELKAKIKPVEEKKSVMKASAKPFIPPSFKQFHPTNQAMPTTSSPQDPMQ